MERPPVWPRPIRVGSVDFDFLRRTALVGGVTCHLSGSTLALLYLLAANAGQVLTREEIRAALGRPNPSQKSNPIDRLIVDLRRHLRDDAAQPRLIETVSGRGYRFVPLGA